MGESVTKNLTRIDYRRASDFGLHPDQLSRNVLHTVEVLQKAGYEAYVVGGSVRDLLIGLAPKDFDIATNAHPGQVVKHFSRCRIIGRRFKIVHVRYGSDLLEISTFRSTLDTKGTDNIQMSDTGMVLRDNQYGCLEDDVFRRDFTINALYYNPYNNELIGHNRSIADLELQCIRMIGDVRQRYCEDPVRILRAIRFCAKTGFTIEGDTKREIAPCAKCLFDVSSARLFEEVVKLFHSGYALITYRLLCHYGLFEVLFPLVHQCFEDDAEGRCHLLLETFFANTDQRVAENKSITPAFMMAVMTWLPAQRREQDYVAAGDKPSFALRRAINEVMEEQRQYISMPHYLAKISCEICLLQPGFFRYHEKWLYTMLEKKRFRAAYDLLCLRASAGFVSSDIVQWWDKIQQVDADKRDKMIRQRVSSHNRYRSVK